MHNRLLNAVIFVLLLLVGQIFVARYVFNWDAQVSTIDSFIHAPTGIYYFGDSVIKSSPDADASHASIAEFLGAMIPDTIVADVSQGASDPRLFAAMTRYISTNSTVMPGTIIIPVNLRSFSPEWYRKPQYQFERQKFILEKPAPLRYFFQPLATLHALTVPAVSQEEFLNSPVYSGTTTVGFVKDFEDPGTFSTVTKETRRQKFIYDYMGRIEANNEELLALAETLRLGEQAGISMLVYITPIDYTSGVSLVGKDFIPQIRENARIVCGIAAAAGTPCIDLSLALGTEHFDSRAYPNEHLDEAGRRYIAEQLYKTYFRKE